MFSFRSRKSDLTFIFRVWCQCIDEAYREGQSAGPESYRFDILSADLYATIAENLPPVSLANVDAFSADRAQHFGVPEKYRFADRERPDPNVLKRLGAELGFEISDFESEKENDLTKMFRVKTKRKRIASRRKRSRRDDVKTTKLVQQFVPDESVDVIRDLVRFSSSESEKDEDNDEAKSLGKRKQRKTWKMRLRETNQKSKKTLTTKSNSSSSEADPVKEEEISSSDEYVPNLNA